MGTEAEAATTTRRVAIIPHTHWDREWYRPFAAFRLQLVELLDRFLPLLEADPGYAHFLLDGQMAVVDDYLELRPGAEATLRRLAAAGRLAVGPWYILMDEFLVSGETIIRNLQLGLDRAASFGGAMEVGYLPDMFGHIAQMPQLLRQAGLADAVVWRGVPAAVDRTAFWWEAPDGSRVRAEYLPVGYGNGAAIGADPEALVRRIAAHDAELGSLVLGPDSPLLIMNGTDHQTPQPWLGQVVAAANELQGRYHFEVTSLASYLAGAPSDGLPSWAGELRSGARANLLMGVASNRVDVHQAAARAERGLERQAEPLCALWLDEGAWPGAELATAWLDVVRNSAHDSICACSADDVVGAVLSRFALAEATADVLRDRAVAAAGASVAGTGPVVVNPSARTRSGVVELVLPGDAPVAGAQVLETTGAAEAERRGRGGELGALLGALAEDGHPLATGVERIDLRVDGDGVEVRIRTGVLPPEVGTESVMAETWAQAGAHRHQPLRVVVDRRPWQRVAVHVADIPGWGWSRWEPAALAPAPVVSDGSTLDNGLVRVVVDPQDGTLTCDGVAGCNRLVDGGDEGDTYNYSPPSEDREVDQPVSVTVQRRASGPVIGALRVTRTYRWPAAVRDGRRVGEETVAVVSDVEVRAGEALVRVTTSWDNRVRDHRLRAWMPLPRPAAASEAECAFAVVTRGLTAEGGPHERALATFPSRRFVRAGGMTVLHEGLHEYELVDEGRALALTLVRATGMLSRDHPAYRPNAAGPAMALEGPQMPGRIEARYALHVGDADPYELADQAWLPLEVAGGGGGWREDRGQLLSVRGAEVSSLRRVGGEVEVRVFNPAATPTTVVVAGRSGWLVDLRGAMVRAFDEHFDLGPWAIATVRLAGR